MLERIAQLRNEDIYNFAFLTKYCKVDKIYFVEMTETLSIQVSYGKYKQRLGEKIFKEESNWETEAYIIR